MCQPHWCSYLHLRLFVLLGISLLSTLIPNHTYARALPTLPAARPATVVQQSSFDCSAVTEIPQSECAALVDLYNSTNGPGWVNQSGWLATPTPCSWFGVTCSGGHVIHVDLPLNQLSGALPDSLGNLTGLIRLDLMSNQLSGTIPTTLGNLSSLLNLLLSNNQLSGTIPVALGNLTNLEQLYLYSNQLSGSIPPDLGNLTNLQNLHLSHNQLTGSIPAALGNLTNLTTLWLAYNQLSGSIPPELGNLTNLNQLLLSHNQLTGSIPAALGNLTNLTTLWLAYNQLSGSIPPELGNLTNLNQLLLSHNQLTGSVPATLGNLTNLLGLLLNHNQLSGPLPASLIQLTAVTEFAFKNTNLCEPTDAAFQSWLAAIANLQRTNVPCTNRLLSVHLLAFDNSAQNIDTNLTPQYQQVVTEALLATSGVSTKTVALLVDLDGVGDTHVVIIRNGAVVQLLGAPTLNAQLAQKFAGWQLEMTPDARLPNSSGTLATPAAYEYDMADATMLGGFLQWLFNTHIQDAAATQTLVSYVGHGAAVVPAADIATALGIERCESVAYGQPALHSAIIPLPGGSVGAHPAFTDCHGRFNPATGGYQPTLLAPRSLAQALTTALNNSPVSQIDLLDLLHCFALSLEALAEFAGAAENGGLPPAKQITGSPHYTYFIPEMIGRVIAQDNPAHSAAARAAALIQSYATQLQQTVDATIYPHLFVAVDAAMVQPLLTAWEGVATRLYALLVDPQTQAATRAMIMTSYQNSAKYDTTYCAPQDWALAPPDALTDLADFARLVQTSRADAALIDAAAALLTTLQATIHQRIAGDGVPRGLHPEAQSLWTFADHAGIALYTDLAPMQITGYGRLRSWQSYWYHNGSADQPTPYRFTAQSQWDEALRLLWQFDDPNGAVMAAFCLPQLVLLPEERGEKLDVAVDSLLAPTDESLPLMEPVYFKAKIATASLTSRYVDVRFQVMMNGEPVFEETVIIQHLLAAEETVEVVTTQPWQPQTGGTATLTVMVDAEDRLRETNEANNLLQQSYVIKPTDNTGVTVVEVWTDVDGAGNHGDTFAQGAPIHYTALTANTTGSTQVVPGTWSATGPCGAILTQSLPGWHIGAGTQLWTIHETVPLTACPGVYTLTTTIQYQGITSSQSRPFTVLKATGAISAPNKLIASTLSDRQLHLTWVDRSDNESGFRLERCQVTSGTTCTTLAWIATLGVNSTTFTDNDRTPNTRYCYRLQGYNQSGVSAYSNVACRTTAPTAPTNLSAQAVASARIKLIWTDNAANESGFKIERCQGTGCTAFSQIATLSANITTLTNGNLAANTTYCYRVRAYNANGNSSYSNTVCPTTTASAMSNLAQAAADESSFDPEGTTIAIAPVPLQLQLPVHGQATIQHSLTCLDDAPASRVTLWVDEMSVIMQPDGAAAGRYQAWLELPTDFPTAATFPLVVRWQCAGEEEPVEEFIGVLEYGMPTETTFQNRVFLPLTLR